MMCEPPSASYGRRALLERHRWLVFVLPLVVFMLVGSLEPTPEEAGPTGAEETTSEQAEESWFGLSVPYVYYPIVYTMKIALTVAAIVFVLPGYREFPFRVSSWAVLVGVACLVVWVGICHLDLERRLLGPLGLGSFLDLGRRSGFDPFTQFPDQPGWAWGFLAIRLFGLAVVVAVVEEFFLRGFAMRFVIAARWWDVPFGRVNVTAVAVGTLLPMLSHSAELFAAAAWFSLVTLLMVKTRNIWDCVVAHGITNLLLGVYVVVFGQWELM